MSFVDERGQKGRPSRPILPRDDPEAVRVALERLQNIAALNLRRCGLSDRAIGRILNVHGKTVAAWLAAMPEAARSQYVHGAVDLDLPDPKRRKMTARDVQDHVMVKLDARGLRRREIAKILNLSHTTVTRRLLKLRRFPSQRRSHVF